MIFDFSFILVVATLVTGVVWGLDSLFWKPRRVQQAQAAGEGTAVREPILVEDRKSVV